MGLDGRLDIFQLIHQRLVDVQTTGGIQQQQIVAVLTGMLKGMLCDGDGIALTFLINGNAQLRTDHLQLLNSGRTINVTGAQQRTAAFLFLEPAGQLGDVGGFTGTLQTHEHDDRGRTVGHVHTALASAHQVAQLVVDDLNDLLCRGQALQNIRADGLFGDRFDEVLDHLEVDVGFQQGKSDFPHGLLNVIFVQATLGAQLFEGIIQFFTQTLKSHLTSFLQSGSKWYPRSWRSRNCGAWR